MMAKVMHFFGNTKLFCHFLLANIEKVLYIYMPFYDGMGIYIIKVYRVHKNIFSAFSRPKSGRFSAGWRGIQPEKTAQDDLEKKMLKSEKSSQNTIFIVKNNHLGVSFPHQCDTYLIGMRHLPLPMRHLF